MTEKQLLKSAIKEIEALKLNATKKELAKLNFEDFDPTNMSQCIYGQITGSCESGRAKKLIKKGCKIFIGWHSVTDVTQEAEINLSKTKKSRSYLCAYFYYSSLETFTFFTKKYNRNIISYLKGNTKNLKLKEL